MIEEAEEQAERQRALPVYLLRHGTPERSPDRPIARTARLTPAGAAEVAAVARELAAEVGNGLGVRIVSSDLARALESAFIVAELVGAGVTVDVRLRELDFGWEGERYEEFLRRVGPDRLEAFRRDPLHAVLPGAEPFTAFAERVAAALDQHVAGAERALVVVAHDGVNRLLELLLRGRPVSAWGEVAAYRYAELRRCEAKRP